MNERQPDDLTTSLKHLGEVGASAGFTERVLEGLDRRLRRRTRVRAGFAAAGVVAATLVALGTLRHQEADAPTFAQARSRADEIRREHDLLLDELDELRRSRELAPTVLYLGGGDDYDLVLDLNPLLDEMTRPAAMPASFTPAARPVSAADRPRREP